MDHRRLSLPTISHPRKTLHTPTRPTQSRTPATTTKTIKQPTRSSSSLSADSALRSEHRRIASELMRMAKQQLTINEEDLGFTTTFAFPHASNSLFERGKHYEVYSARRNERLQRRNYEFSQSKNVATTAQQEAPGMATAKQLAIRRVTKKFVAPVNFSGSCAGISLEVKKKRMSTSRLVRRF